MPEELPVTTGKQRDAGVEQEIFPTFEIGMEDIPEVENWTVGERYKVNMEVELSRVNQDQNENKTDVAFKVIGITPEKRDTKRHYADMVRQKIRGARISTRQ